MLDQLKEAFGLDVQIDQAAKPTGLPVYMTNNRVFYNVRIDHIEFLLVSISDSDRFGVIALEKQMTRYMKETSKLVVYTFPSLTKTQRDSLVGRKLPFIVLPEQIYLPFMGIAMSNQFKREKEIAVDHFTPASQCLFFYFLYSARKNPIPKKDAAGALGLTRTSITRASEQLKALGLITEDPCWKEIRMTACAEGKEFYDAGKPYLINPVHKRITVKADDSLTWFFAGESALGKRTMLNEPEIPIVAIDKKQLSKTPLTEMDEKWETEKKLFHVEVWKYDPALFADNQIVDPVSMAVSLKDCMDERVQGELEEFLEAYQW